MHVNKTDKIEQNNNNIIDIQSSSQQQPQASVFGDGFRDKNGNDFVDSFDFDNDEEVIKMVKNAGLMGQLWKDVEDKVNSLLKKSNIWTVQNNQSISEIATMILEQTQPNYTQKDIINLSKQLISMNSSKLDGTKQGFLVNAQIELPVAIDISKIKQSENPVFDYVWNVQSKRIKNIVSKYNLIEKNDVKSETYNDALLLSNEFIQRYGYLDSASREYLILSPHFDSTAETNKKISAVRKDTEFGFTTNRLAKVDKNVREYNTGNCSECSELLVKMCFEKFQDKYKILELSFEAYNPDGEIDFNRSHVAMLMESKDGKEKYVIDPWISPKNGAIFNRCDWETMVKEIYRITEDEKTSFYTSSDVIDDLKYEKYFYENLSMLSKEIPSKKFDNINNFVYYVSLELRKGNLFNEKVMALFKHYASSEYDEIFKKEKDFYARRDLITKEVSPEASITISDFGEEVFNNLIQNKNYSKEIMNLFKKFCPDKYYDYLKTIELRKHSDIIQKTFPDKDINELTNYYRNFSNEVWTGMYEGKKFSKEIMDLYFKCDYDISLKLKREDSATRIKKAENDFSKFEKNFSKNMSVETLDEYLNSITDEQATLIVLQNHYENLITNIDNAKYGWGNGKNKKELIMPFIEFISQSCSYLPKEDIDKFKQTCLKELNAKFYTDEKEILNAFNKILTQANSYYKQYGYFDNTLWLK